MKTIRDLNKPPQIEGWVESIIVRGSPREVARTVSGTMALAGIGLADDRLGQRGESEPSTRQVTLLQAEHLAVIDRFCEKPMAALPTANWRLERQVGVEMVTRPSPRPAVQRRPNRIAAVRGLALTLPLGGGVTIQSCP